MRDEHVMVVAHRAAELLPAPPAAHDSYGYLAWEELVLGTARRLQWLLDDTALLTPVSTAAIAALKLTPSSGRLDAASLTTLAVLLVHDETSCETLLADAVATGRDALSITTASS